MADSRFEFTEGQLKLANMFARSIPGKDWLKKGNVELYIQLSRKTGGISAEELLKDAEIIEDVPFITLESLIDFKREYGRAKDFEDAMRARLIGLYRLRFRNPSDMIETVRGEPVYLLAAMTADEVLRLKPQNLVTGLPIRQEEAVN